MFCHGQQQTRQQLRSVCHVFSYGSKNGLEKAKRFPEVIGWKSTQQIVTEVGIVCVSNFL
jgi:hypothetical protein